MGSRAPTSLSRSDRTPTNLSRSGTSTQSGRSIHSAGTGNSGASKWSIDSADTVNSVHTLRSLANQISAELYPQERLASQLDDWQNTLDPVAYRRQGPWPPEVKAVYNEYKRLGEVHAQAHQAFEQDMKRKAFLTPERHLERARLAVAWGEASVRYVLSWNEQPFTSTLYLMLGPTCCRSLKQDPPVYKRPSASLACDIRRPYRGPHHKNHQYDHLSLRFTSFFPPDTSYPRLVADNTPLSRAAEGRLAFIDTYRNAYSSTQSIKDHILAAKQTINSGRRAVKEARTNYESMGILSTILAVTNLDDNFRTLGKV